MKGKEGKALVVHGSPRKDGNTDTLLGEVVRGIREVNEKIKVEEVYLRNLCILPCRECRACDKTGRCVVNDDMQKMHVKLVEADYIILGSPIFFYTVTGWAKAMIDRSQALWAKKYLLHQPLSEKKREERGGWFVSVGATKGRRLFDGAVLTVRYFFDAVDVPYRGDLLVRGVDGKGEIMNHPQALFQAHNMGKEIDGVRS